MVRLYKIVRNGYSQAFEEEATTLINLGYYPVGSLAAGEFGYVQGFMYEGKFPPALGEEEVVKAKPQETEINVIEQ